jgi:hypothetical protein
LARRPRTKVRRGVGLRQRVERKVLLAVKVSAYLEAKDFGLDEGEGFAVDFDETFSFLLRRQCSHHRLPFISIPIFNLGLETLVISGRIVPCTKRQQ